MSDIEAMFHQVKVCPDDRNAPWFLWWTDSDLSKQAEEFQMTVHLFGSTSSPSCANFALQKTANNNEGDFNPVRNFYVDNCLKAVKSNSYAVKLAGQLNRCLTKGGFRLTKWISNRKCCLPILHAKHFQLSYHYRFLVKKITSYLPLWSHRNTYQWLSWSLNLREPLLLES